MMKSEALLRQTRRDHDLVPLKPVALFFSLPQSQKDLPSLPFHLLSNLGFCPHLSFNSVFIPFHFPLDTNWKVGRWGAEVNYCEFSHINVTLRGIVSEPTFS